MSTPKPGTVQHLIEQLQQCDPAAEVGYIYTCADDGTFFVSVDRVTESSNAHYGGWHAPQGMPKTGRVLVLE